MATLSRLKFSIASTAAVITVVMSSCTATMTATTMMIRSWRSLAPQRPTIPILRSSPAFCSAVNGLALSFRDFRGGGCDDDDNGNGMHRHRRRRCFIASTDTAELGGFARRLAPSSSSPSHVACGATTSNDDAGATKRKWHDWTADPMRRRRHRRTLCSPALDFAAGRRMSLGSGVSETAPPGKRDDEGEVVDVDDERIDDEGLYVSSSLELDDGGVIGGRSSFDYTGARQRASSFAASDALDDDDDDELSDLPKGKPDGFYVVEKFPVPSTGFDFDISVDSSSVDERDRLSLTPDNVTLPVALTRLDPEGFPSLSRARKACRKGSILLHRGPLSLCEETGDRTVFDPDKCIRGRVGDRVFPNDVVCKQVRMGNSFYPSSLDGKPPFDLPVVFEDDHFAIVNKPAGVIVYGHRKGGHGRMTVRAALPFALKPPRRGTMSIIRRPQAVHRLDKPTSGLLLVAKTKPAMIDLTRQFVERKIKKTYTAVVNGIPAEPIETSISTLDAQGLGVDVKLDVSTGSMDTPPSWQLIDQALDEKSAVTIWRTLRYAKSLKAKDNYLSLIEVKPKTGRYHQIRRHMAWVCDCPLVGDTVYDGGGEAMQLRKRGLFLCSNEVTLEHPYYNTKDGRKHWDHLDDEAEKYGGGMIRLSDDGSDTVLVSCAIELPEKFEHFLDREEDRALKFLDEQ